MNKIFYGKDNKYMNTNFISSFEDIKKYKHHYFTELCMTRENSFTLFNYGPYIANHMPDAYSVYCRMYLNGMLSCDSVFRTRTVNTII